MKPKYSLLKAYASAFSAFLVKELAEASQLSQIKQSILFGSVARADAKPDSDVDIFIDVEKENKRLKSSIEKFIEEFYHSKEALLFKIQGIDNKINVIVGKLGNWKDLHRSIMSTGIMLWGPFTAKEKPIGTEHKIIFHWSGVEKNRGAFLNKLYGFKTKQKYYSGLIEQVDAQKLGKSCVLVPIAQKEKFITLFKKYGANAKAIEVFVG